MAVVRNSTKWGVGRDSDDCLGLRAGVPEVPLWTVNLSWGT